MLGNLVRARSEMNGMESNMGRGSYHISTAGLEPCVSKLLAYPAGFET